MKYNNYKINLDNSKKYIRDNLYLDYYNEYKKAMNLIKELFQYIKNNNKNILNEHNINELYFIHDNIKKIDILNNRFDKYISDNIFNNNYQLQIDEFQNLKMQDVIKDQLQNYGKENNNIDDFCINYKRKITYWSPSGLLYNYDYIRKYCHSLLII